MFRPKTHVRIIEADRLVIEPSFIAVPLPDGKILIQHGNFENPPTPEAAIRSALAKHVA